MHGRGGFLLCADARFPSDASALNTLLDFHQKCGRPFQAITEDLLRDRVCSLTMRVLNNIKKFVSKDRQALQQEWRATKVALSNY
jgi:hypothetical protein